MFKLLNISYKKVMKEDVNKDVNIVESLKTYADSLTRLAQVRMVKEFKDVKDAADGKVSEIKGYLEDQAKMYRQNKEKITPINNAYKEQINDIDKNFEDKMKDLEEQRQKLESEKMKKIAKMVELKNEVNEQKKTKEYKRWKEMYDIYKKDLDKAEKTGDKEKYEEKVENLKAIYKDCPINDKLKELQQAKKELNVYDKSLKEKENEQKDLKKDAKDAIEKAMGEKTTALSKVEKQSFIKKFIGSLINKISGTRKFAKDVMKPMEKNLSKLINETIPNFVGNVGNDAKNLKDQTRTTILNVIEKGKEKKNNIIRGVAEKINAANEKTQEKIKTLEGNKTLKENEEHTL